MPTYDALIERYGVLDRAPGRDLQSLVSLIAQICGVPHAVINILSSNQQHQIVAHGIEPAVCAREDSMCAVVMDDPEPVIVPDASNDVRFSSNPFVNGEIGDVRFYASAPVTTADGLAIGRLCVFDVVPHELTDVQQRALAVMASQVTDMLELRYRSQALEDSLRDLTAVRDELRRSNEHLIQFAGQVSHDLRTPLTAILINAELLAGEPAVTADTGVSEMVLAVKEAGHRMDAMIEEMLTFARENGRLRLSPTDLSTVVSSVVRDVAPLIMREGAEVKVGELPVVLGDPDLLYSVVLNLLTNAVKFVRPGEKAVVSITADRLDRHWRVRVTDNGIGVPPARRAAMFELFARQDEHASGHGIGLATARRIVEAHGGTIGMESAAEGGTSVWFDLPV
ncbi:GAF domain-containing sensor histidine kinase [Aeromicrobium yanjiei]|uniref:Sensor-like histidine kinase SenX3 n=1 Tax=Aeromicrobium yanjiei TaxID=2662028 RepID=A0A5Q2MB80_9ACTN|nr:GAF domain-containing sensor histidine kinase [Aeromicrobium yanjiei]QGG40347.1 histidine kinase [Aeromicrobium yanjiei]